MGMLAILINGPWPFVQIFNPPLTQGSTWSLKKIGPGVTWRIRSNVWMDGWQTDGRPWTARDHNSSSWAALLRWAKKRNIYSCINLLSAEIAQRVVKGNTYIVLRLHFPTKIVGITEVSIWSSKWRRYPEKYFFLFLHKKKHKVCSLIKACSVPSLCLTRHF